MRSVLAVIFLLTCHATHAQKNARITNIDSAWANNSVNTVVFRKNSLVTFRDTQYTAFYNKDKFVVLGKRKTGSSVWQLHTTSYKGNAADAHNCISIMIDGDGYLHLAWDHHNNPLHYCRSIAPGSLELTQQMPMTGKLEQRLSYPEFYKMPNGNLLFFYRNGESGSGNLVINTYDIHTRQWTQLHNNLIDGEGLRNAYWQAYVDAQGIIHISWVWRESPDVASNHDMCYARSSDGGQTWEKSNGEKYTLPITASSAEYAATIPPNSELINQTSMCTDNNGNVYIATYWSEKHDTIPQYHIIYNKAGKWSIQNTAFRKTSFSLSGAGTKRIPIARPQVIAWQQGSKNSVALIFRDEERNNKVSIAFNRNIRKQKWVVKDIADMNTGSWEPTYDTELWKEKRVLNLFVEKVEQRDAEGISTIPPQMAQVVEWNLSF